MFRKIFLYYIYLTLPCLFPKYFPELVDTDPSKPDYFNENFSEANLFLKVASFLVLSVKNNMIFKIYYIKIYKLCT